MNDWSNSITKGIKTLMVRLNANWEPMYDFDCYVAVDGDTLFCSPMNLEPEKDKPFDWGEVTAPQSQEFLDAVNEVFETDFNMVDFSGR